jgi:AsmA protein
MMALAPRRLSFLIAAGLACLLVAAAAVFYFLLKANLNKARLEATASAALGMEVRIGGPLGTGFFPGLLVTLQDVRIRNRGLDVASAQQASLQIELLPLLKNEVRITKIALKHPAITIEKDRDGHFNFEQPQARGGALPGLDWPIVSISDATLVYADKRLQERFEAQGCHVDVRDLRLAGGSPLSLMKDLAFTAKLGCTKVLRNGFTVSDLKFSAEVKNGIFELTPVTAQVFGTQGSGRIHADFSKATPVYQVHYSLPQFPIEEFLKTMSRQKVAAGRMDFSADLSMQGTTEKQMRQTANGQVSLRGSNLTLSGTDLDRAFARFESSQNFSLVDVGAFFFVGPLGLVVTRGLNFATIQQDYPGNSEIRTLVSQWRVERGVARAQDVAMATKENRVALQGGLDFVDNRFDDVTVALIDARGCATVRQHIHGTFANPVVDKPNRLEALAGPVLRLLKKGSQILGGEGCDVFYAGSVAAPK